MRKAILSLSNINIKLARSYNLEEARVSASQSVDVGSTPLSSHTEDLKTVFTASSIDNLISMKGVNMEKKPASSLVVSSDNAVIGIVPSLRGRQMVGSSSLPVVVAQLE